MTDKVDAFYIRFEDTTVTTKHLADGIAADYDSDRRLAGIEILECNEALGRSPSPETNHTGRHSYRSVVFRHSFKIER